MVRQIVTKPDRRFKSGVRHILQPWQTLGEVSSVKVSSGISDADPLRPVLADDDGLVGAVSALEG